MDAFASLPFFFRIRSFCWVISFRMPRCVLEKNSLTSSLSMPVSMFRRTAGRHSLWYVEAVIDPL